MKVYTLWLDEVCQRPVEKVLQGDGIEISARAPHELTEEPLAPEPDLIICSEPPADYAILEFAQFLNLSYPKARIIYASSNKATYNRGLLQKNGIKDAYLVPFENGELEKCLADAVSEVGGALKAREYRSVKLVDLNCGDPLDFDTYMFMPLNRKYLKLTKSGSSLREDQMKKLKEHDFGSIHIRRSELPKFYQFTAQQLVNLDKSATMSATEKQERMQQAVRAIVSGVFAENGKGKGFDDGRELLKDCQEIVKSYITGKGDAQSALFQKLLEMSRDEDNAYTSASNVATFASLFSIGLKIGSPDELALAGLLKDIGIATLPAEVQTKSEGERSTEEEAEYRKHPEFSVRLLKAKRMTASEKVFEIILQHHENFDGSGYPHGLSQGQILPEAQVLAIASYFDELLSVKKGKRRLNPRQALQEIIESEAASAFGRRFDRDLLKKIADLML